MPQLSSEALPRHLRERRSGGTFFLHGDEAYLRDAAVAQVVAAYLDPATRDFNFDQRRGAEIGAEELASLLATPPLMAEWRVVVLRDVQGLSQRAREVVATVARATPPGLVLVLSGAIPAGSQAKFYTELKDAACSVEFAPVDPLDAPGWLMEQAAAAHALELQPEAARALVVALGSDLGLLSAELTKLAAYVGERRQATAEDVRAVTGKLPRQDRWAWFDLVAERRWAEALAAVPTLLQAGETAVGLVIGMAAQLLRVGLVCAGGQTALERELKPYQRWLARRIVPQAKRWTTGELEAALAELLRADRLLKSASLSERQALEELLLRLAALPTAQSRAA